MKQFATLKEYMEYIPSCLICQKPLSLTVEGYLVPSLPASNRRSSWGNHEIIKLRFQYKDGMLRTKHKTNSVAIEAHSNRIVDGADFLNRLVSGRTYANKMCSTCAFKITANYADERRKKDHFAPVSLYQEQLTYTMKGGKSIQIQKWYHGQEESAGKMATIALDKKWFGKPIPLEFAKFSDIVQLTKRLKTIIVFQ